MKIVIVGGGTAGITLARRLLEQSANTSVTVIDSGPRMQHKDRRIWLDYVARSQLADRRLRFDPYSSIEGLKSDQDNEQSAALKLFGSRYFGVGGSTNAWGGWCLRYREEDFHLKSLTGEGADWPIAYADLAPYYEKAEKTLWVAGADKPNPPIPYTLKDGVIIEAFKSLGIDSFEPLPLARKAKCVTIGTCRYCPVGMRYVPEQDLEAVEGHYADRFTLMTSTPVVGLEMASRSKCSGVLVSNGDKKSPSVIAGDLVVLCAGAVETPKILLNSKPTTWRDGVGNDTGHVGKHITAHPLVRVIGTRKDNPDNLEQPVDFPTLACRAFDTKKYQKIGKLFFVRDGRRNATNIEERLLEGAPLSEIRMDMRDRMPFELRGFIEIFSHPDNHVSLGSGKSSIGTPTTKVNFKKTRKTIDAISWAEDEMIEILKAAGCKDPERKTYTDVRADHATSTCRMSAKPSDGVVDENLCIHGTKNVYVCSNAVLPNGAAVNPTLTLIALTERLAETIAKAI